MFEIFKGVSIEAILQFYAVTTLLALPFSFIAIVILYKKTNLIQRLNARIDKMIERKYSGGQPEQKNPDGEKALQGSPAQQTKDIPEKSGISCFSIPRGGNYFCRQTSMSADKEIYNVVWFTDNAFVGSVDKEGLFEARHEGTVNVFRRRVNDAFDQGAQSYRITVRPETDQWECEKIYANVINRRLRADVLSQEAGRKILVEKETIRSIEFYPSGNQKRLIYQFDEEGRVERAVVMLRNNDSGKQLEALRKGLDERLEKVSIKKNRYELWVRRNINIEHDEIEAFAWIKEIPHKSIVLVAFSNTWREYGEVEEFLLNIEMTQRLFLDIIPEHVITLEEGLTAQVEKYEFDETLPQTPSDAREDVEETNEDAAQGETDEAEEGKPTAPEPEQEDAGSDGDTSPEDIPEIEAPGEDPAEESDEEEPETAGEVDFDDIPDIDENL